MEKFSGSEYKSEKMDLKTEALQKYFTLLQIREQPSAIEKWGEEYGVAFDSLADAEPKFLEEFNKNPDATAEEFETKLQKYL